MNQPQVYMCPLPFETLSHLPPHSTLQVDTEPLFEFPEPYSKFPLAIYFTYGSVSFHVTLSIHPTLSSPFPMSISLFSMPVSPLLPCKYILQYDFSRFHICVLEYDIYLSLSDSLHFVQQVLGSSTSSELTQMSSFLWLSNIPLCMYHSFFIHSSVDGHLSCFHALAIVNCAAMNNGIHVNFSILVSSGYMPRSGISGSYGGFFFSPSVQESPYHLPQGRYQFTFPPTVPEHSLLSTRSPAFIVYRLFDDGHFGVR